MDGVTGAGIAELFRVLDPEGHTPEKLQAILVQMGAKAMAPKGTPKRGRRGSVNRLKIELEGLARQSSDGSKLHVSLNRLVKWWDPAGKGGCRLIAEILGIQRDERLSALSVLNYVNDFHRDEKMLKAVLLTQSSWRGKMVRRAITPRCVLRQRQRQRQRSFHAFRCCP
jgi:hypothetical protein